MQTSNLKSVLILCLTVIVMLGLLSSIPAFEFGGFTFKRIDPLSAVRAVQDPDSVFLTPITEPEIAAIKLDSVAKEKQQERCPPGVVCMEDYSSDSTGLRAFNRALSSIEKTKQPVRIAFFGDSFIEGDVFCGAFRDSLQSIFGGRGVGFVPITSEVAGFRNTIKHAFDNWSTHSIIVRPDSGVQVKFGPSGHVFRPRANNWVEYRVSKQRFLREFSVMKMYYANRGNATMYYTVNDSLLNTAILKKGNQVREWKYVNKNAKSIQFEFEDADSLDVYGASFESAEGVFVDNFSLRGNSGVALDNIPEKTFKQFNEFRDYKLIILQYGLNVLRDDSSRYGWYAERMITVINKIKRSFPKASIVLLSVSDRSSNFNGEYKTAASIPALRNTQRYIAQQTGVVFWDMFEAMGGKNSMVKFVNGTPVLAAKDYTHLNFKGGRKIAGSLVQSLLYELERYEKKKKR